MSARDYEHWNTEELLREFLPRAVEALEAIAERMKKPATGEFSDVELELIYSAVYMYKDRLRTDQGLREALAGTLPPAEELAEQILRRERTRKGNARGY